MERVGGGTIPEFRHQGEDFEYIARYSPDFEGTETPWVASIHDDSGRYSSVSGHATDLADAQSLAVAYHQNEWQPGTEKDLQNPDNPDYVAEGTEGMWGDIKKDIGDVGRAFTGRQPKQPEHDWDAPTEADQDSRDLQYKDNPNVWSGKHGEAGGKDPLGWSSPKDKAQRRSQEELKGSLDPLASDDDFSRSINSLSTPSETSREDWRADRAASQDEWDAGAHERENPHLYPDPLTGEWPKGSGLWDD
jgi:hypothetical protein